MMTARLGGPIRVRQFVQLLLLIATFASSCISSLDAQVLIRLGDFKQEIDVVDVYEDGNVWILADKGLFYLTEVGSLEERLAEGDGRTSGRAFRCITRVNRRLLLGAEDGLFEITEFGYRRVTLPPITDDDVLFLQSDPSTSEIFLATKTTLYRKRSGEVALSRALDSSYIYNLKVFAGTIWATTNERVYYLSEGEFEPLPGMPVGFVADLMQVGERIYLLASRPVPTHYGPAPFTLYEHLNDVTRLIEEGVLAAQAIDGALWYAKGSSIFKITSGIHTDVGFKESLGAVTAIAQSKGFQYIVTPQAIVRRQRNQDTAPFRVLAKMPEKPYFLEGLKETQKGVVLFGKAGVYLVHEDTQIDVQLKGITVGGISFVGNTVKVDDVRYVRDGEDPFHGNETIVREFRLFLETTPSAFDSGKVHVRRYSPASNAELTPGLPISRVYLGVHDSYGNLYEPPPKTVWAVAGIFYKFIVPLVLLPLLFAIFIGWPWPLRLRLWAFFGMRSFTSRYPLYGGFLVDVLMSPSQRLVRWWLRRIVRRTWSCGRKQAGDAKLEIARYLEEAAKRYLDLFESELSTLSVDCVERQLACSGKEYFPVRVEIGSIATQDPIGQRADDAIIRGLDRMFIYGDETFYKALARKGPLVLILPYDVGERDHIHGIEDWLSRREHDYAVLVPRQTSSNRAFDRTEDPPAPE